MSRSGSRRRRAGGCCPSMSRPCARFRASSRSSPRPTSRAKTTSRRLSATIRSSPTREISFHGQALFAVVATERDVARRAVKLAAMEIEAERPSVTVEDALERGETVLPDYAFGRGDAGRRDRRPRRTGSKASSASAGRSISISKARSRSRSRARTATCSSIPRPSIRPRCSTWSPACSTFPDAYVTCETRRMGGGFGGKESQATQWAVDRGARGARDRAGRASCASTATTISSSPASATISAATGASASTTRAAIQGYAVEHLARCGYSADLSGGVVDRTMFHSDNAYWLPAVRIGSKRLKTNTVSNTAFRGFGGPQGMLAIEHVIDQIAWATGRDPLDVRYANFYAPGREPHALSAWRWRRPTRSHALVRTLEQTVGLPRAARRRSRRSTPPRRS